MNETINEIPKTIDLKKFCAKEESRFHLESPHSRGQYTYATNGHILIRVPRNPNVGIVEDAPDCERLFAEAEKREYTWVPIPPDIPPVVTETVECYLCNGKGQEEYFDDGERYETCDECSGSGKLERIETVVVEFRLGDKTIFLANRYVLLIAELPNAEIGLTEGAAASDKVSWHGAPVKFRFDDGDGLRGDGLLMPRRS